MAATREFISGCEKIGPEHLCRGTHGVMHQMAQKAFGGREAHESTPEKSIERSRAAALCVSSPTDRYCTPGTA